MFGEISLELIKELQRSKDSTLPPWNDDVVGRVVEEMEALFHENQKEVGLEGSIGLSAITMLATLFAP